MIPNHRPSISKNLTIGLVSVIVGLSTLFMGIYYYQVSQAATRQLEKTADITIHSIVGTLEVPLWDVDRENIDTVCNYYIQNDWVVMVKLIGISGEVMFDKCIVHRGDLGDVIYRTKEIAYEGETIGRVEIALSAFEFRKDTLDSLRITGIELMICVVVLMIFTGFWLQRLIKLPLGVLERIADAYSKGDYRPQQERAPYKEFDAFVAVLFEMGKTIELQMNELKAAELFLKRHRDSLEEIVAERTKALEISNQKLQDEIQQRKVAQDALRMNEQRLEAILSSSPVGIGLVVDGMLSWANDPVYQMVGYDENELLNEHIASLFENPEAYSQFAETLVEAMLHTSPSHLETRWIRKDHTAFDCIIRVCPLDVENPSKGQIYAVSDISDKKASEQALREKERLQGVLELSGAVSHEMTQPLMSVMGYFDLMLMDMPEDALNVRRIEKIKNQLERMSDITKKLMEISKYRTKEYLNGQILDLSKSADSAE